MVSVVNVLPVPGPILPDLSVIGHKTPWSKTVSKFILRRLGYSLISLLVLSLTIFFFVRVTGDPAALLVEPGASEADIAIIHHQFGLDRPLWVQYAIFMS